MKLFQEWSNERYYKEFAGPQNQTDPMAGVVPASPGAVPAGQTQVTPIGAPPVGPGQQQADPQQAAQQGMDEIVPPGTQALAQRLVKSLAGKDKRMIVQVQKWLNDQFGQPGFAGKLAVTAGRKDAMARSANFGQPPQV